jgi:hypothetical protein
MLALYLAHEVEEEDNTMRVELIREAFGQYDINRPSFKLFMQRKDQLWKSLNYHVIVKKEECQSVMNRILQNNYIWRRERSLARVLWVNQRMVQDRRKRQGLHGQNWNVIHLARQIIKMNPRAFGRPIPVTQQEKKVIIQKQGSLISEESSSKETTDFMTTE